MAKTHPDCPSCTCGLTLLSWSDREQWVDYEDAGEVANAVMACAWDHSYDRTDDGVPDGVPESDRAALAAVVAQYPHPREIGVEGGDERRMAFRRDLVDALRSLRADRIVVATRS